MSGGGFLNTFFSWLRFGRGFFQLESSLQLFCASSHAPTPSVYKCWSLFSQFRVSVTERMTGGLGLHSSMSFEWSLK